MAGVGVNGRDLVWILSLVTGVQYNVENFYYGYMAATDKSYAIKCTLPYVQFLVMMYLSTVSRFYEAHALRFIVICGLFLLYANAIFNLNSMAGMRYNWLFFEPFLFLGILALDSQMVLTDRQAVMLYVAFTAWLLVKYLLFM